MFFIYNIAVFFGGKSPERDVSVITGLLTLNSLDKTLYNPIPVYVDGEGRFLTGERLNNINFYRSIDYSKLYEISFLPGKNALYFNVKRKKKKIDLHCAINCMLGRGGEDGGLVGLLRLCSIPFVSPDIYSSAVAIDKDFTKITLKGLGINVLPYVRIKREAFFAKIDCFLSYVSKKIGYPLIIKPARLGSSIGIKKANDKEELYAGLCEAFNYDGKVICEKFLTNGRDVNCAVYRCKEKTYVSEIEEALKNDEILSFNDKYAGTEKTVGSRRVKPKDIDEKTVNKIKEISKEIYRKLDFTSLVRFDFLYENNQIYLNEINTIPGSMAFYLYEPLGIDYITLIEQIVENTEDIKKFTYLDTQILKDKKV